MVPTFFASGRRSRAFLASSTTPSLDGRRMTRPLELIRTGGCTGAGSCTGATAGSCTTGGLVGRMDRTEFGLSAIVGTTGMKRWTLGHALGGLVVFLAGMRGERAFSGIGVAAGMAQSRGENSSLRMGSRRGAGGGTSVGGGATGSGGGTATGGGATAGTTTGGGRAGVGG